MIYNAQSTKVMSRRKTSHQSTSELTDYYPTAEVFVDSLLIVNALSTATVISGRNISPINTSKFNHYDRTAEVIVDTERPVNREGNNIKSCLYRVARESKIPEHILQNCPTHAPERTRLWPL